MNSKSNYGNSKTVATESIRLCDFLDLEDIQRMQDLFSDATGVASIITNPDGTPITSPSNFCRLCKDIISKTEKGLANCLLSDARFDSINNSGSAIHTCLSTGLWEAGTSIHVGGKHIANWLIGPMRNNELDEEHILKYADEIGVERADFREALHEVPLMSAEQFIKVSKMLTAFASELSEKAYNNLQLKIHITDLEKSKSLLKDSEENLEIMLNSIGDGVISIDNKGLIQNINSIAENLCGCEKADAVGKPFVDVLNLISSEVGNPIIAAVKKVLKNDKISTGVNSSVLFAKEGTKYLIAGKVAPIKNKQGTIRGVVLVISDISAKSKIEKALRESERSKSVLLSNLPGLAYRCLFDRDWTMEFVSDGCLSLTGYEKEALLHNRDISFNQMILPEYREHLWMAWERAVEFHEHVYEEYRIHTADNREKWVWEQGIPIYNEAGEIEALEGLIIDITERKHAEEKLLNEHVLLRTLIDNIPDFIYSKDLSGRKTLANRAEVELLGANSEADVVGKDDFGFYPKELAERFIENDQMVLQSGVPEINTEEHIFDANGHLRWLLSCKLPLRDKNNQIIGLVGIGRDITERKKAELALQESEELYRNLVEKLPDGVYKSTHSGKFVDVNPAMVKMLGYASKEELMAIDIKTQLYFEESDRESVELQEKLEKIGVYRMKKKDGSEIWVEDHGWLNFDEKAHTLFHEGIMRDVTERKHAELALQESEALYRNLVLRLPDGVYKSTHEGKFVDANPALVKLLGYSSKDELMAIDIKKQLYFEPADRESLVLQEKLEETGVYRLKKKDGSPIWVEDHGWYNLDENGNILFHEGIMRDITERKWAEEEIKLKNEELTKIVTEKDKFFSIIAHDLRSPFNSFLGLTHIMAEELPVLTMDELQKIAVSMNNSAINLFRLLENLLQWSRMQQGLIPFNPNETQLRQIIDECIIMVSEPARNKEIEIICNIPAILTIFADNNMIQTVIRNLVSNAVKFTARGGKIIISAKNASTNGIEISIKDTGIGISKKMMANLFRLDVQVNRSGTEGEPSTGLGLLLCKEFVEKHGGNIWLKSEEGKGSVFYFSLPNPFNHLEPPLIAAKKQEKKQGKSLKILIVEDDETSEMLISMVVKVFSKEVLKVKTGIDAIETCRNNPDIDLVMMDIKMPGIDGYEATRQIRQFNPDVFIIAQSASELRDDSEKAIEAGCNHYISKPINISSLKQIIQKQFMR